MAMKDLVAKIILKGGTDPSLERAFKQASILADSNLEKLKGYGEKAATAMKLVGTATGAGLVASAKSAIDYESAFAGVMKTVDETATTSYEDISSKIREMSKEMPAAANEIAEVAAMAGQLGIKADDLMGFTKVMIDLGETTNLSSEDAASAIAKLFNVTGTSMDKVGNFGATLVDLGNNAATTENDIMNMASRIASSANQIGLTEPEILAMATSLSSVGMEAEAGGTAISTVMTKIDKSVATNDKTLQVWADTAGLNVNAFKKLWEKDAYGAMQKVIGGMGDVTKNGGNLNLVLEELGITGIREADTMKRLASASEVMNHMTEIANDAWVENSALTTEANTRYATMASRIQMMKNRFYDMGITIGEALMPHMENLMTKLEQVDWVGIANKVGNAIKWIADNSTTLVTIIGAVAGAFAAIKILGFVKTIIAVVGFVVKLVKTFGLLKVVLLALGGPVTIVVGIIGLLVGAFVALWMKSEKFRNFWIGLWNKIKATVSSVGSWLKNFFTVTIPNFISKAITFFKQLPAKIPYYLGLVIGKLASWGVKMVQTAKVKIPQFIKAVISFFKQLPSKVWTWLVNTAQKVASWGGQLKTKGTEAANKLKTAIVEKVKELPSKLKELGKDIVKGLWNGIKGAGSWIKGKIGGFVGGIVKGFKDGFDINSPSVVMADKIGKFLPQGIGVGMLDNAKYAISAVQKLGGKVVTAAQGIKPQIGIAASKLASAKYINPAQAFTNAKGVITRGIQGVSRNNTNNNNMTFTFAPVINGTTTKEVEQILEDKQAEFEKQMTAWLKKNRRLAF